MKKFYSFALMALTMGFVFVSCDDEKETPEEEKGVHTIHSLPVNSIQGNDVDGVTTYTLSFNLKKANQVYLSNDTSNNVGYYFRDDIELDPFVLTHSFSSYGLGEGFTFTSCTDVTTPGYTNISAITAKGVNTNAYLTAYANGWSTPAEISFKDGKAYNVKECYVTNATYAYLAIKDRKDGNDQPRVKQWTDKDVFTLTITGYNDTIPTESVEVRLADGMDIVNEWKKVDLTRLGEVTKIEFSMSSTDLGDWGINTPTYFCLDQLTITEPGK